MKKIFCLTAVLILSIGVFQGCSVRKQKSQIKVTSRQDDISQVSKAQKIEIISCKDRKTIAVLKNKDGIQKLIDELRIDDWKTVKPYRMKRRPYTGVTCIRQEQRNSMGIQRAA